MAGDSLELMDYHLADHHLKYFLISLFEYMCMFYTNVLYFATIAKSTGQCVQFVTFDFVFLGKWTRDLRLT